MSEQSKPQEKPHIRLNRELFEGLTREQRDRAREREIRLWTGKAPEAKGDDSQDIPMLYPIVPDLEEATGAAMIVCPGGGYRYLASHEGVPVAEWLAGLGIIGFVLKYRVFPYTFPAQLYDIQRALRTVRARANEFNVDPHRVGVIGFSAGGHLCSVAATQFDHGKPNADDPIERESGRPDLAALFYPVIDLQSFVAHSERGALDDVVKEEETDTALLQHLSTHLQVTEQTPATFLWHNRDDEIVHYTHSLQFAQACQEHGVPFELHILGYGEHGFGTWNTDPKIRIWQEICANWLRVQGFAKSH